MKKIGFIIFLFICLLSMACSGCRNKNNDRKPETKTPTELNDSIKKLNNSIKCLKDSLSKDSVNISHQLKVIKVSNDSVKASVTTLSKTTEDLKISINRIIILISILLVIVVLLVVGIVICKYKCWKKQKNNSSPKNGGTGSEDANPNKNSEETKENEAISTQTMCDQQYEKQSIINKKNEWFSSLKDMIERLIERVDNIEKVMEERSRQPENPTSLPKTSGPSPQFIYAQKDADKNNILRENHEGLYKIILSGNEQNKGELHINQNPDLMKQALDARSCYINGICEIKNMGTGYKIKEENPGIVRKENGVWVVEKPVEISIE